MNKLVFIFCVVFMVFGVTVAVAENLEEREIDDSDKVWEVFMTDKVEPSSVEGNVYIKDQYDNNIDIEVKVEGERIIVAPKVPYKPKAQYKLVVSKDVAAINGVSLEEEVVLPFKYIPPSSIASVDYEVGAYLTKVEVTTRGMVQKVKVNNHAMHYTGQRVFELGLVDVSEGSELTISTYDSKGKLIETKKVVVGETNV